MNFIIENWGYILSSILIPIATWIGGRKLQAIAYKKSNEELKANQLDNLASNFSVYQNLINDLETRFKNRIGELEEDIERMKILNQELRKVVSDQERYIKKLRIKIADHEKS